MNDPVKVEITPLNWTYAVNNKILGYMPHLHSTDNEPVSSNIEERLEHAF